MMITISKINEYMTEYYTCAAIEYKQFAVRLERNNHQYI